MADQLPKHLALEYRAQLAWLYDTADIVGIPSPQEIEPLRLEQIYVPLQFRWSLDKNAERVYLPQVLEKNRHLVVLGDPGSGKSTLIKVIVDMFGRSGDTPLKQQFGELIPIPIILRDYNVREWQSFDQMLAAYLERLHESITALDEGITPEWLLEQLGEGKAMILFDGLDEVGSRDDRRHLRDQVIRPLLKKFPDSYAILTSRIVGYDEAPFENYVDLKKYAPDDPNKFTALAVGRCYVAPFNDEDIEQYVVRWYSARESDPAQRRESIASLQSAINLKSQVKSLATNPQLLTLIAIVHRALAVLPSGRVELYDKVAEAYLLSIDKSRNLISYPATLDEMKRWLACVGWEMQSQRDEQDQEKGLLATKENVLQWLHQAILEERGELGVNEEAARFLSHIARRSGLLIPRGPEEFAFAHLTFQEYFAANYLGEMAFDLEELARLCTPLIERRYWHETLCILFEILVKKFRGASDRLFDKLHEKLLQGEGKNTEEKNALRQSAAELYSELLLDEQNGLTQGRREIAAKFTLTEICREYNSKAVENLKFLTPDRCDQLIIKWFDDHLNETVPDQLGRHFFIVGNDLVNDWPQRLVEWVAKNPDRELDDLQIAQVALFAARTDDAYRQIAPWAVEKMSLTRWLAPINNLWVDDFLNLADAYRKEIEQAPGDSVRVRLLRETHILTVLRKSQALRLIVEIREDTFDFIPALEPSLSTSRSLALSQALRRARDVSFYFPYHLSRKFSLYLVHDLALNLIRSCDLALTLAMGRDTGFIHDLTFAFLSSRPAAKNATETALAEWLFFAPDAPASEFDAIIAALRPLAVALDDWTQLQGLTALLTLGEGSIEIFNKQNALIEKGIKRPDQFTFPIELHSETEKPEFRRQLPDLFKLIFLYDPDDSGTHWLKPEFFDPAHSESKNFLSKPREFFILAADALDPNGETELGQWRRKIQE